jgi:subtilisin family serine protease
VGAGLGRVTMDRPGYVVFTLRPGEALERVPAHLDLLGGAARAVSRLDGGPVDRALRRSGDGFRAVGVFHARRSLAVPGEQHVGYDDVEESLGMSRTYRARLADESHTDAVIDRLRSVPTVESAAVQMLATTPFDATAYADAPGAALADSEPDPHDMIRSPEALVLEPGDERVIVACVDTGIALGHAELQRKLLAGYDTVDLGLGAIGGQMRLLGDSRGHDFSPLDDVGHGSQVAGIIGAQGWRMRKGVAGRAMILPIRVLAAARSAPGRAPVGIGALPDIDAGVKVAVDLGANVMNLSLGTPADSVADGGPLPHTQVVAYATRNNCVLVAAAGNSGKRESFYPAALPDVMAVASVDRQGIRSSFSTYGSHIAIAAPGERVNSSSRRGYKAASGTSFASPFVAAAAALVVAHARRTGHELGPRQVRDVLLGSARPLAAAPNEETGHGLLDVAAAIQRVDNQGGTR